MARACSVCVLVSSRNYYTTNGQRQRLQRQQRRLAAETAQEREQRLRQLSASAANQQRRLAAETAQERKERLRQLSDNQQRRSYVRTLRE